MSIFDTRKNYKPFEYPDVKVFIDAMAKSYWVAEEVEWGSTVQDFHNMSANKKEVYVRTLLSIAQVEVAVKSFWGDLGKWLPKPEFHDLGMSLGEAEVRHATAYSKSLEVLDLEDRFKSLLEIPAFKTKLNMIDKVMADPSVSKTTKLLFFTLVIENSSLFSQFAICLSFSRFEGIMKNISNMIGWSATDEDLHSQAGIWLLKLIQKEQPLFEDIDIEETVRSYVEVEEQMLDWIFENGELEHFSKTDLLNYIKYRLDKALGEIGISKVFNITNEEIEPMKWFEEEIYSNSLDDFFTRRPVDYTKHDKSITAEDLF